MKARVGKYALHNLRGLIRKDSQNEFLEKQLQEEEKQIKAGFFITGVILLLLVTSIVYVYILFQKKQVPLINTPPLQSSHARSAITPSLSQTSSPTTSSTNPEATNMLQGSLVKDYFIPLGSGTNQTSDWADVPGVQAVVDFGQYPNIKEIHFEASVYVPTANESVFVRLYNVTDKHTVWYSDVAMSGNSTAYLSSPAVIYDTGSKLYQVQMKTQLQALANLAQARIHIILR